MEDKIYIQYIICIHIIRFSKVSVGLTFRVLSGKWMWVCTRHINFLSSFLIFSSSYSLFCVSLCRKIFVVNLLLNCQMTFAVITLYIINGFVSVAMIHIKGPSVKCWKRDDENRKWRSLLLLKAERAHRVACFFDPFKLQIVAVLAHLILELIYCVLSFISYVFCEFCRALDFESAHHFIFLFWKTNTFQCLSFIWSAFSSTTMK